MNISGINRCLLEEPRPLYSHRHKLCLLWSAKSGCTFAIKWFLFQEGLLEAALEHSSWIHDYRTQVFYQNRRNARDLAAAVDTSTRVVRFVRNPFQRTVSSYLAYCQSAYESKVEHSAVTSDIGRFLKRSLGLRQTFSFREFVEYLKQQDLDRCDIHFRRQRGPCETDRVFPRVRFLPIEQSGAELPKLESEYGLLASDGEHLLQSPHHLLRSEDETFCGDRQFFQTYQTPVPHARAFYDPPLIRDVYALYRDDFDRFGYPPDRV